jgi:hypothetical protein
MPEFEANMTTHHESIDPELVAKLGRGGCTPSDYFPLLDQLFEAIKQTATLPLPARMMKPKHAPRWLSHNCHLFHDKARAIVEAWKQDRHVYVDTINDWQFYMRDKNAS